MDWPLAILLSVVVVTIGAVLIFLAGFTITYEHRSQRGRRQEKRQGHRSTQDDG
jgi:hypothetical protein